MFFLRNIFWFIYNQFLGQSILIFLKTLNVSYKAMYFIHMYVKLKRENENVTNYCVHFLYSWGIFNPLQGSGQRRMFPHSGIPHTLPQDFIKFPWRREIVYIWDFQSITVNGTTIRLTKNLMLSILQGVFTSRIVCVLSPVGR